MADKKISEFPTFDGEQGPKTYYIISSGDPGEANSANYRVPFSDLTDDILLSDADLISGKTGAFDLTTGMSGSFTDKLLISGVEVLTGFSLPGGGDVIDADEGNVNFGATEEDDDRAVNFQQGGETKLELSEDGEVIVKSELFTTEPTTISIFEGPVTNNSTTNLIGSTNLAGSTSISGPTQVFSPTFEIGEDVVTTISGSTFLEGPTTVKNSLTVADGEATTLGGTLEVKAGQATTLGGSLTVAADQATALGGTLDVAAGKATTLGGNLTVADGQITTLGGDTTVKGNTTVKGDLTSESLILQKDGGFMSTLTTGEGGTSDRLYFLPGQQGTLSLVSQITWNRVGPSYGIDEVGKVLKVSDDSGDPELVWVIDDKGLQADWNEDDDTSDAFIKNKPASLPPASHSLSSHSDVSTASPSNGQVLKWNGTTWAPATDNAGTTISSLSDIDNVSTVNPSDGQVLKWDNTNSEWAPATDNAGTTISSLSDIDNVSTINPSDGQVLKWNNANGEWAPAADNAGTTISSLNDIDNVTISSATDGDALVYNGTNWVNSQPTEPSLFASDASLKENVSQISSAIEKIQSIRGVNFTWNDQAPKDLRGSQDIGVIAQEVQSIAPSAVSEKDGLLHVQYHKIIPLLIQSIHELSNENKSLKLRISKLES